MKTKITRALFILGLSALCYACASTEMPSTQRDPASSQDDKGECSSLGCQQARRNEHCANRVERLR